MLKKIMANRVVRKEVESAPQAVENSSSALVHLQRAAEIYQPVPVVERAEESRPSGLLNSIGAVVRRVRVVRQKKPQEAEVLERLEHIFTQLHQDFDERERMLDKKLQAIETMQARESRMLKWFSIPLTLVAMVGLSFLFYIAYAMQHSVADMSQNMAVMSGDISAMTSDTQNMSRNMAHMTGSMHTMNNNMAYMTRDVSVMSRGVGAMSRSVAPIGKAAGSAAPMIGMMRSFMPF